MFTSQFHAIIQVADDSQTSSVSRENTPWRYLSCSTLAHRWVGDRAKAELRDRGSQERIK
jgi:hypothetical protein